MPKRSNDYRAAVWAILSDGRWHSALELIEVGGIRAGARVHELRRGEDGGPCRRILCTVRDSVSRYRWTCDCGPLPANPDPALVPFCPACRAALAEVEQPRRFPAFDVDDAGRAPTEREAGGEATNSAGS